MEDPRMHADDTKRGGAQTRAIVAEEYRGPRSALRALFELAEDSTVALDAYIGLGRVLVARRGDEFVGHLQVVPADESGHAELKSMAVREADQGQGIGSVLVDALIEL